MDYPSQAPKSMNIYLCPSPDLYHLYHIEGASVIITDIFRASTTICKAFQSGAERILPVATTEECEEIGTRYGYLMAAERKVLRCPFADLGNDPLEYSPERVMGKTIVMTTTNGTRSLAIAHEAGASEILVGSFRNMRATLSHLHRSQTQDVVVLAAGWQGQVSMEDCLYAAALAYEAELLGWGNAEGDMAVMLRTLWGEVASSPERLNAYIQRSEHYERLLNAGHEHAIAYCLESSDAPAVALSPDGFLRPLL